MLKPRQLQQGDRVAAVTLSWGGPGAIPHRYQTGKHQLEKEFGLTVLEMPHTLADAGWLARNPQARADDLMQAFSDESIDGIVSSIGGDDSIRLILHLDLSVISQNPKPFIGYSDTTISHLACYKAGVTSFYGPAMMAGCAENGGMHQYLVDSFRQLLFKAAAPGTIPQNEAGWTVEFLDWTDTANAQRRRTLNPCTGWRFLQGSGVHKGHLIGGCLEAMEWLRGTNLWPSREQWSGAILFLETSEEAPPPRAVARAMRVYAAEGVLANLAGILFGRPGGQVDPSKFDEYDNALIEVVRDEQGLDELPIISGMDFGHTDPIMTLPYGVLAEIDCSRQEFQIVESAVVS